MLTVNKDLPNVKWEIAQIFSVIRQVKVEAGYNSEVQIKQKKEGLKANLLLNDNKSDVIEAIEEI
ncbi:hypothetical protein ACFL27_16045 [candidate division CSSED10-310 bacterium]|uniref:Uncharacterized protein n=1 Tax=candidate division CSSED10-310 bacterium TaxID=2855610 RepID=A0ABV6YZT9_UNCC1